MAGAHGDREQGAPLGAAAALGLPLPPGERPRPVRLPVARPDLEGVVPLLEPEGPRELPVDVVAVLAFTQRGRLRLGEAIARGLAWRGGQALVASPVELDATDGDRVPALLVEPTRRSRDVAIRVTSEQRVTLPADLRRHLLVETHGSGVLIAFRATRPARALLLGDGALSAIISGAWSDAD